MEGFIKRYDQLPIREFWLVDIEDGKEKDGYRCSYGSENVGCFTL